MSERLSVQPDGLATASAALSEGASEVQSAHISPTAADRASTSGAADIVAAIDRFSAAYAERLRNHAQSMAQALARYTAVDGSAAADIDSVVI